MPWGSGGWGGLPTSGTDAPTNYAASNLSGIAKVMAVNPELGQSMLNSYQERTQPARGFFSGLWNAVSSGPKAIIEGLGNITSAFAEPFRQEEPGEGDNALVDFWQGLSGQENTTWKDNLLSYGWEDNFMTTVSGLALDIFADPTTYIGAGMLGKAGSTVAKTGEKIAAAGAKETLAKQIAARGGLEFGGQFIGKTDDFGSAVQAISRETFEKAGVHPEVVDGLAGVTAANAELTVISSVDDLMRRSYESVGRQVGDVLIQRKSLRALPAEGIVDDIGRSWSKAELMQMFKGVRTTDHDALMRYGNEVFGFGKGAAGQAASQNLKRMAAAAEGGIRLKFGLPFGEWMAKTFDSPFLGYRWTTAALPYANRFRVPFVKAGNQEVAFTKIGDFFRGVSGINRLDQAITRSIREGGVWTKDDMSTFLRGGFSGLQNKMVNEGGERAKAFYEIFGNKATSTFMSASERVGGLTAAFTPGAQAWRRAGIVGLKSVEGIRTAKQSKKVFRSFAAQHEETWSKAAFQMEQDAKKGLLDKEVVNERIVNYLEGVTDDIRSLPEYLHEPLEQMRTMYPQLLRKARDMGADVGDIAEAAGRRRAEEAIAALEEDIKVKEAAMNVQTGGATQADEFQLLKRRQEVSRIKKHLADHEALLNNHKYYEETIAAVRGPRTAEKGTPSRYFHRRLTREAREAMLGSKNAETTVFNKAKRVAAERERELAGLPHKEAEKVLREEFPALKNVAKIWEDNAFLVYGHYVEDMAEAVYRANLGDQARYLMSHLGAVDNGAFIDFAPKVRADMERTLAKLTGESDVLRDTGRQIMTKYTDDLLGALGAKPLKRVPVQVLRDLGLEDMVNIPGKWRQSNYADLTEIVPTRTLRALREFDRAGQDAIKSPGAQAALVEDIRKNGFDEAIIIEVDKAGRAKIGEGNHRLAAAEELGFAGVPARVVVRKSSDVYAQGAGKGAKAGQPKVARGINKMVEEGGYVPADLKPSDVLPEGMLTNGRIRKLPEEQLRRLQTASNEINKLRTKIKGVEATPEVAIVDAMEAANKTGWGRVDVPGLEGVLMHPFIAAEFNKAWRGTKPYLPGGVGKFQQAWRSWLMGPWKKWATIYWPGFHARNFMGAWFNNTLGGVQNHHYTGARKLMDVLKKGEASEWATKEVTELQGLTISGTTRKLRQLDGQQGKITYGRLADVMRDLGVYAGNSLALADMRMLTSGLEEVTFGQTGHRISRNIKIPGSAKKVSKRHGPVTGAEFVMREWERFGVGATEHIENWMRGAAFLKGLEDGAGDTAAARAFTMMRHGDYDELTDAEMVIKDLLPFYKWIRTNLPFQIRRLIEAPGQSLATLDAGNAFVDEDMKKKLPDWMRESFKIQLPKGIAGSKDAPGFLSLQLPLSDVYISSGEFASSFLPVVRQVILENGILKKNMFTGAPITGNKFEKVAGWVEATGLGVAMDAIGLARRDEDGDLVMDDKTINMLGAFPVFSRARNWLYDEPARVRNRVNAFVSAMAGIGLRPMGPDELNAAEADYFFSFVKPMMDELRGLGYELPDIDTIGSTVAQLEGQV